MLNLSLRQNDIFIFYLSHLIKWERLHYHQKHIKSQVWHPISNLSSLRFIYLEQHLGELLIISLNVAISSAEALGFFFTWHLKVIYFAENCFLKYTGLKTIRMEKSVQILSICVKKILMQYGMNWHTLKKNTRSCWLKSESFYFILKYIYI